MSPDRKEGLDYLEIPSLDLDKTRLFFSQFCDWKFTAYGPDYMAFEDVRLSGGFFRSKQASSTQQGAILPVFYSTRLEWMRARALELGAEITRDIFSFPGGRRFQFTEPGGSEFAVWSDRPGGS